MSEQLFVWTGTVCYIFAFLTWFSPWRMTLSYGLLWGGVSGLFIALALRWQSLAQGPFMTLYEVLVSTSFSLGLVYAFFCLVMPSTRRGMPVATAVVSIMMLWATSLSSHSVPLPPTFDNFWLWLHLVSGKLFLGTLLSSLSVAIMLLIPCGITREKPGQPEIASQDTLVWKLASIAFVFDSCMLLAGAVWAHHAWGRYWSWDPLETWAFITWLSLAIVLHARLTLKLPEWIPRAGIVLVFVIAFLTFFGVPFFSDTVHKGVM